MSKLCNNSGYNYKMWKVQRTLVLDFLWTTTLMLICGRMESLTISVMGMRIKYTNSPFFINN
jgi:hypothetical protein